MLQKRRSGDGCDLESTLCKYDWRKGELFVLSWVRVRGLRRVSITSERLIIISLFTQNNADNTILQRYKL